MGSPRRRILLLLSPVFTFLLWTTVFILVPADSYVTDPQALLMAAAPPLCVSLSLALILFGEWRQDPAIGPRRKKNLPEWEVIPLDRYKPPGLETRKRHRHVVVVARRHIRRLPKPTFLYQKRRALGLPGHPPGGLNRRRPGRWHRRLVW